MGNSRCWRGCYRLSTKLSCYNPYFIKGAWYRAGLIFFFNSALQNSEKIYMCWPSIWISTSATKAVDFSPLCGSEVCRVNAFCFKGINRIWILLYSVHKGAFPKVCLCGKHTGAAGKSFCCQERQGIPGLHKVKRVPSNRVIRAGLRAPCPQSFLRNENWVIEPRAH